MSAVVTQTGRHAREVTSGQCVYIFFHSNCTEPHAGDVNVHAAFLVHEPPSVFGGITLICVERLILGNL